MLSIVIANFAFHNYFFTRSFSSHSRNTKINMTEVRELRWKLVRLHLSRNEFADALMLLRLMLQTENNTKSNPYALLLMCTGACLTETGDYPKAEQMFIALAKLSESTCGQDILIRARLGRSHALSSG